MDAFLVGPLVRFGFTLVLVVALAFFSFVIVPLSFFTFPPAAIPAEPLSNMNSVSDLLRGTDRDEDADADDDVWW